MPQVPLEHRLTAEQIDRICVGLKAAQSMELLFMREGVPRRTYYDCKKRLEDALLAHEEGQAVDKRTHQVAVQLFAAWADGGLENVRKLLELGDANQKWQHRAWLAERSWWQIFGRRVVLEENSPGTDKPSGGEGPKAGETDTLSLDIKISRLRFAMQRDAVEKQTPRPSDHSAVENDPKNKRKGTTDAKRERPQR